jgi:hypothetical protein
MPGLMRGGWIRGPVSGPPSLQRAAWTAPDRPATAPASYSTASVVLMAAGSHHSGMKIDGRRRMLVAGRPEGEEVGESWCGEPGA